VFESKIELLSGYKFNAELNINNPSFGKKNIVFTFETIDSTDKNKNIHHL
jgi:hypothetical protein